MSFAERDLADGLASAIGEAVEGAEVEVVMIEVESSVEEEE
jgi:hypothetical protein